MTKQEWVEEQRIKEIQALDDGYTWLEIRLAYKNQKEIRGVSYLDSFSLKNARKQLKKQKNDQAKIS